VAGLAAALEEHGIAALQGQGADLDEGIGPRLEDHAQHAQGTAHAGELETRVELAPKRDLVEGIRQVRHRANALGHGVELGGIELQAPEGRGIDEACGGADILGIGREDFRGAQAQLAGQAQEHAGALLRGCGRQVP